MILNIDTWFASASKFSVYKSSFCDSNSDGYVWTWSRGIWEIQMKHPVGQLYIYLPGPIPTWQASILFKQMEYSFSYLDSECYLDANGLVKKCTVKLEVGGVWLIANAVVKQIFFFKLEWSYLFWVG